MEHCPSLERYSRISEAGQYTVKYGEKSVQNAHVYGVEPAWHSIEHRPMVIGRELSDIDAGRMVCLIEPELRDKLGMDKDCIGETIRIGSRNFRVVGVIEKRTDLRYRRRRTGAIRNNNSFRYGFKIPAGFLDMGVCRGQVNRCPRRRRWRS